MTSQTTNIGKAAAESSTLKTSVRGKEVETPVDRLYTKEHMWVKTVKSGTQVGITNSVCRYLGSEVALIELTKGLSLNAMIEQGQPFGVLYGEVYRVFDTREFECKAFDLCAPVSGKIVEINTQVLEKPQIVGKDPFNVGWIVVIEPLEPISASKHLMNPKEYKRYIEASEKSPFRVV